MATVSIRFYTVKMPDGNKYSVISKSRKKVSEVCGVSLGDVSVGANSRLPDITQYFNNASRPTPNAVDQLRCGYCDTILHESPIYCDDECERNAGN